MIEIEIILLKVAKSRNAIFDLYLYFFTRDEFYYEQWL